MRKRSLLLMCLCVVSIGTSATLADAQVSWRGGLKGGANWAQVNGADVSDIDKFRTGFVGGGFITAQFRSSFAIQVEALYVQKGGKAEQDAAEFTLKLDYVEIPVLIAGRFPAGERAALNLFGGPSLAFRVAAKATTSGLGSSSDGEEDIKEIVRSTDLGLMFGFGFDIVATDRVHVVIGASLVQGLIRIDDSPEDADVKNFSLGLTAGLSVPFGGTGS